MRRAAFAAGLVVLLAGLLLVVRPFVAASRDYPAEVVSPAALHGTASVPVEAGAPVCFDHAVLDPRATEARFTLTTPGTPAPALRVRFRGEGYRHDADVPAGSPDGAVVRVGVPQFPEAIPLRVCIARRGPGGEVALLASADRTRSRSLATAGGEETGVSVWFAFYESSPRTIVERLPETIDRMTAFRPGFVTPAVLWVLAAAFLVGMPLALLAAYGRALRDDGADRALPDVRRARSRWRRLVG